MLENVLTIFVNNKKKAYVSALVADLHPWLPDPTVPNHISGVITSHHQDLI